MSRPDDELRTRLDRGAAKPSLGCSDAPMQLGHRRIVDREVIFGLIMMATKGSAIGMPATSVRQADEVGAVRAAPTAASMAVTRTGDDRTAPRRGRNGVEDGPTRLCWSARNANLFAGEESRVGPLREDDRGGADPGRTCPIEPAGGSAGCRTGRSRSWPRPSPHRSRTTDASSDRTPPLPSSGRGDRESAVSAEGELAALLRPDRNSERHAASRVSSIFACGWRPCR